MANLYRKKPVVVQAVQWHQHGDHDAVASPPKALLGGDVSEVYGFIYTREGGHIVSPGDWIITGVKGEHYPCKPDIFAATYEPADAAPRSEPVTERKLVFWVALAIALMTNSVVLSVGYGAVALFIAVQDLWREWKAYRRNREGSKE